MTNEVGAFPKSNTASEFSYRVAAGIEYALTENFNATLDLSFANMGKLESGKSRSFPFVDGSQPIGAYKFEDLSVTF